MIDQSNFSDYMEDSLYGERGFYTSGGGAGRSRDYITSPEVGDLFGRVIASYIDDWYESLKTDEPAVVIDAGCGPGSLAASIARAEMVNAEMIDYALVDRSIVHLKTSDEKLQKIPSKLSFSFHENLPDCEFPTLVIANELLDNLVFNIGYADEVYKTFEPDEIESALLGNDTYAAWGITKTIDNLQSVDVPFDLGHFRIPLHTGIANWLKELSEKTSNVPVLSLLIFDYMKPVIDFEDGNWLRMYANDQRIVGVDKVIEALNSGAIGDITTDVIKEDLQVLLDIEGYSKIKFESQKNWLNNQGIDAWCKTLSSTSSNYEKLKTFVDSNGDQPKTQDYWPERNILTDETGLGNFTVVEARREI